MQEERIIKKRNRKKNYDYDIHIKLPKELYEKIKEEADKEEISYARFLRKVIEKYLA